MGNISVFRYIQSKYIFLMSTTIETKIMGFIYYEINKKIRLRNIIILKKIIRRNNFPKHSIVMSGDFVGSCDDYCTFLMLIWKKKI